MRRHRYVEGVALEHRPEGVAGPLLTGETVREQGLNVVLLATTPVFLAAGAKVVD
ncbi:MAG: hypothetical protein ACK52Z_04975 [Acidobacteriota bacterium]|jgi:hypothetical protein